MTQARDLGDAANKANFLDNVSSDLQTQVTANILPAGLILPFGNTTAPTGYLACDGTAVSRTTYATLFAAIGTTWGTGDGSTTFNVPDFRGAFLRGTGSHGTQNMANGNDYAGPSVGSFENDKVQRHTGSWNTSSPGHMGNVKIYEGIGSPEVAGTQSAVTPANQGSGQRFQNTSGASSSGYSKMIVDIGDGPETRPFNAGVLYCIKT